MLARWGLNYTAVDQRDLDAVRAAVQDGTRVIWCETPTNPLLGIVDITAIAAIAHDAGALLVVDNTFASTYLQRPMTFGADVVMHSTTKYLGGHSDVIGGAVIVEMTSLVSSSPSITTRWAASPAPFDAWLVLRGIKTLGVRMDRHCDNAERVAAMLREHEAVTRVYYPDGDELAKKQMARFGGVVSFQVAGGEAKALDVCAKARVFTLAESLGGVESLIEHPGRMTHSSVAGSALEVPSDLVRLSVGIETVEDLLADLRQALA